MGEKRKARVTNKERTSKREKKTNNSVLSSASNDEIEEQSSMHSNGSNSDNNSQQPSVTQENTNPTEIEEPQTITPIDVENVTNENPVELNPLPNIEIDKIPNESTSTTKSWWSSLVRLFHFGHNATEIKPQLDNSVDHQTSAYLDGSYLGKVKCRRSLHGETLVG